MKKSKFLIFILTLAIMIMAFSINVSAFPWTYMFSNSDFTKIYQDVNTSSHPAIDIISKSSTSISGATIKAIFSGSVAYKYDYDSTLPNTGNNSAGNYVLIIEDGGTYKAGFMHMTNKCSLSVNDSVNTSTTLGTVGNTGYTTGATGFHLHHSIHSGSSNWASSSSGSVSTTVYDPKSCYNVTFSY